MPFPQHQISSKLSPEYFELVPGVRGSWAQRRHSVDFAHPKLEVRKDKGEDGLLYFSSTMESFDVPAGFGGFKPHFSHFSCVALSK